MKKVIAVILLPIMVFSGVAAAKSKGTPAKSAYLYVVRGNIKLNGAFMNAWFYLDGHKIADLYAKQYAVIPITPGRHEIALRSDTNYKMNKKNFTVKAGESVYYEAGKTPGRFFVALIVPIMDMGITKAYSLNKLSQKAFEKAEPSLKKIKPVKYLASDTLYTKGAELFFFRPHQGDLDTGTQTARIYVDSKGMAELDDRQYAIVPVSAGTHTIAINTGTARNKAKAKIKVKDGQKIYIDLTARTSQVAATVIFPLLSIPAGQAYNITQVKQKSFDKARRKMKRVPLFNPPK